MSKFVFLFALHATGFASKHTELKVDFVCVTGPGKHTVCRRVPALFSPEILQALAVKGLTKLLLSDL